MVADMLAEKVWATATWLSGFLLDDRHTRASRRALNAAALACLFLLGAAHWVLFLGAGHLAFTFHDWRTFYGYHWTIRQALAEHRVPFHIAQAAGEAARFLGNPEVDLSPQVLLLPLVPTGVFILLNVLLCYSIGFAGCLLLKRKFSLGLLPFLTFFLIFNLNGFITSHMSVGHLSWLGYFLLPVYLLYLFSWPEGEPGGGNVIGLSLVLTAMLMQGAFHIFTWCFAFLLLTGAVTRRTRALVLVSALTSATALFRLAPTLVAFAHSDYHYNGGFHTLTDLVEGLVRLRDFSHQPLGGLGWWEYDFFVGLVGVGFLAYFGVWLRFRGGEEVQNRRFRAFDWPMAILAVMSLNHFYRVVGMWPVPFVHGERVTSRFLILPLIVLTLAAAVRLQQVLACRHISPAITIGVLAAVLEMGFELVVHSTVWRLSLGEASPMAASSGLDVTGFRIANRFDPAYVAIVKASYAISFLAVLATISFLAWRLRLMFQPARR